VKEVSNPAMKSLEGKNVAEIAKMRGRDGLDTFLDLGLEDNLKSSTPSSCLTAMTIDS
jgi:N-acyl-D-aspartate/D-glutamate deacylase